MTTSSKASRPGQTILTGIAAHVQMLAFSEGELLAERGGVDRELALKVMKREPRRLAACLRRVHHSSSTSPPERGSTSVDEVSASGSAGVLTCRDAAVLCDYLDG